MLFGLVAGDNDTAIDSMDLVESRPDAVGPTRFGVARC
jgi:hypothetical protein